MLGWPRSIDVPLEEFLPDVGRVVRRFGERRESGSTVIGVETSAGPVIVKHAVDPAAIGWLRSSVRLHDSVSHPSIPPILHHLTTADGFATVQRRANGEVLVDGSDSSVPNRDETHSTYRRFLALPVPELAEAVRQLLHAHLPVAASGFVAVDLHDGSLMYDFDRRRLWLIDLDMYRPGPYVLDTDRQYGSSTYMAPEEWTRGATIDERSTVFTLGRFAHVLLGCTRHAAAERHDFRGSDRLWEIATHATAADPADRYPSVSAFHRDWTEAILDEPGALPRRPAVRVVIIDGDGRTLLCQFGDDATGRTWWVPPGGGLEPGETHLDAAGRELGEELDRPDLPIGPCLGTRAGGAVLIEGRPFLQQERVHLCRTDHFEVPPAVIARSRPEGIRDIRWWTTAQLRDRGIDVGPRCLPDLVDRVAAGEVPSEDDLGW